MLFTMRWNSENCNKDISNKHLWKNPSREWKKGEKIRKHRYLDWDVVFSQEIKSNTIRIESLNFEWNVEFSCYTRTECENRHKMPEGRYFIKINFIEFNEKSTSPFFITDLLLYIWNMDISSCMCLYLARMLCECVVTASRKRDYLNANNDSSRIIMKVALKWREKICLISSKDVKFFFAKIHIPTNHFSPCDKFR